LEKSKRLMLLTERVGGHFLEDDHTIRNFRKEFWVPTIMDRLNWESWEKEGSVSIWKRALKEKNKILKDYRPDFLDIKTSKQIDQIVKEAEKVANISS